MNRVKEFRKELGMSQLELAKDIGVSRQTINMIEKRQVQSDPGTLSQSRSYPPNGPQQSFLGSNEFLNKKEKRK